MDVYRKKPAVAVINSTPPPENATNPSIAPLITMIAVLAIILIFCFCGAPAVREFCRKKVCCCCPEPEDEAGAPIERCGSSTPTIILLPFGRMLVVDRSVFAHFQADETGLDFMELSANLIRAHRLQFGASTPSILESEATSKGLSPISLGYSPPAYEDIVNYDLPPSYSELSLLFRQQQHQPRVPVDNCCVQVTASLNDVVAAAANVDFVDAWKRNNNNNNNNEHITTASVLHIVDERDRHHHHRHHHHHHHQQRPHDCCTGLHHADRHRTESDTNIHKKYRILSKQSSF